METQFSWTFIILVSLIIKVLVLYRYQCVKYYVKYGIYFVLGTFLTLFLLPFFFIKPGSVKNIYYISFILRYISKPLGIKWELRNGEVLAVDRGAVVVANHQSFLDILGLLNIWSTMVKCSPVAKKEIRYYGPFGLCSLLSGFVFIDRKDPKKAIVQMEEAANRMKKEKVKLLVFPEGTRDMSGDSFLPFKKGAFRIAITSQVPVIPIVFSPYYFLDGKKKEFGSGTVVITALPAIPTAGLTMDDLEDLMAKTRSVMLQAYNAVAEEVTVSFVDELMKKIC